MTTTTILWLANRLSPEAEQVISQLQGFEVERLSGITETTKRAGELTRGGIFVSLPLEECQSQAALKELRRANEDIPIVVHDPCGELADSSQFIRDGGFYCIFGALRPESAARVVQALVEYRTNTQLTALAERVAQPLEREPWRDILVGECAAIERVVDLIRAIAPRQSTVLITGETGTGKEIVARAIHMASGRGGRQMVAVNCSALPEALLEAELFGHVKGAFTGAVSSRIGRFEQANHSTIFLDEIGDLPLETQGKLLRVLQERELQRVGSTETVKVDARVVAATNVDLAEAVKNRKFREDLFYRLQVVPVQLPALRDRGDDIPLLVEHFLEKLCRKEGLPLKFATPAAIDRLCRYPWPGNVRQLEHAVEMAVVLSGNRRVLEPADFPLADELPQAKEHPQRSLFEAGIEMPDDGIDFDAMMCQIQRYLLTQALEKAGGNKSRAAEMLRMKRSTLVSKVKTLVDGNSTLALSDDE